MSEKLGLFIDVPTAADLFGVSQPTVRRWIRSGLISAQHVGPRGHYRVSAKQIEAMLGKVTMAAPTHIRGAK